MKSIYLLKEDFKNFPIGEFPYDKNHSAMGEYHFVQYPGYYGNGMTQCVITDITDRVLHGLLRSIAGSIIWSR